MTAPPLTPGPSRFLKWIAPAVISIVGLIMFFWSRGTWPDVLIDFGRELYVPWRITQGEAPYRDIATFYGPLSPYVNALWFTLFGVSLNTLVMCNLALLALFTSLICRLLLEVAGHASAVAGGIAMMILFAFPQFVGAGNYNFICPYSHEMTHGVMLGTLAIALLGRHAKSGSNATLAGAGFAMGLVFLTKLEPLVATASASAAGLTAILWSRRNGAAPWIGTAATFVGAAMLPPLLAFALLATAMPANDALRGTFGSWIYLGNASLRRLPFFQVWGGLDDPGASLLSIVRWLGLYAAALVPAAVLAWRVKLERAGTRWIVGIVVALVWFAALVWTRTNTAWYEAFRPLPVLMVVGAAITIWTLSRHRRASAASSDFDHSGILRLMLFVFAGALMLKMILNARIHHYGFALALPATLLLIATLLDWIPKWFDRRGRSGWLLRAACCGILLVVPLPYLRSMHSWIDGRDESLGGPGDEIFADLSRGPVVSAALDEIYAIMRPGETLVALPEGVMINYLARRPTSSHYLTFLPPDVMMFGEESLLESLRTDPPALILLVHRSTREYGVEYFGRDYAVSIFQWVVANYQPVDLIGAKPFQPNHEFGIIVMRRTDTIRAGG